MKTIKRHLGLLMLALAGFALPGCARFSTTQHDYSYAPNTNGTQTASSAPIRKITTKVTATTFFDSSSELSKFKASQTDKTQGASVGGLNQSSTSTNLAGIFQAIGEGVVKGLK